MKCVFLDFDRTLFDTEAFYNSLELTYIEGIISGSMGADFSKFLYPDVIGFLNNCQSLDYKCFLITFGRRRIQECKVRLAGIESYFTKLFYVEQGSKANVIKNYLKTDVSCEKLFFLDDTCDHLADFSELIADGVALRMCRKGAKGSDIVDDRFTACSNLDEVYTWLAK